MKAGIVEVGDLGHISMTSGVGHWPEDWRLLTAVTAGWQQPADH